MSTQVPFKLVLGHNIARTVFTSKAHILDIRPGNKPAQVLGKEQHTGIRGAFVFHVEESERRQLIRNPKPNTIFF